MTGAKEIVVNKTDKRFCLHSTYILIRGNRQLIKMIKYGIEFYGRRLSNINWPEKDALIR